MNNDFYIQIGLMFVSGVDTHKDDDGFKVITHMGLTRHHEEALVMTHDEVIETMRLINNYGVEMSARVVRLAFEAVYTQADVQEFETPKDYDVDEEFFSRTMGN